ncbi:MAG: outer membrane lipid asymmetry maintenance protein MlaD [Desulfosarcinaceae bacterium]|jgi:phospholipid/cholesterol/gamma-HCH transport system substrate-binding protein
MKKSDFEMAVGVFVLVGILCVGYLTIKLGQMEILGDNHYELKAKFDSVTGLKNGSQVEIAGVKVGQVESITLDPESMMAIAHLKIRKDIELSDDVIAAVKTAGLIGDKYISLIPGGSPDILEPGDTIIETESALDIEELVSKYVFGDVEK